MINDVDVKTEYDTIGEAYAQDLELSAEVFPETVDVKLENCQSTIDEPWGKQNVLDNLL